MPVEPGNGREPGPRIGRPQPGQHLPGHQNRLGQNVLGPPPFGRDPRDHHAQVHRPAAAHGIGPGDPAHRPAAPQQQLFQCVTIGFARLVQAHQQGMPRRPVRIHRRIHRGHLDKLHHMPRRLGRGLTFWVNITPDQLAHDLFERAQRPQLLRPEHRQLREPLLQGPDHLHPLDRIHPQIRLEIHAGVHHLDRIAGLLRHDLAQRLPHRVGGQHALRRGRDTCHPKCGTHLFRGRIRRGPRGTLRCGGDTRGSGRESVARHGAFRRRRDDDLLAGATDPTTAAAGRLGTAPTARIAEPGATAAGAVSTESGSTYTGVGRACPFPPSSAASWATTSPARE